MSHKFFNEYINNCTKHLWCASVYNGTSSKKKINLIEMIVYGKMTGTLEKQYVEKEISNEEARNILERMIYH